MMKFFVFLTSCLFIATSVAQDSEVKAVQLYSQDELIRLINRNEHLSQVVLDRCQLVRDIEARAATLEIPAYQFLWGDMLAWGVCVDENAEKGVFYMKQAADHGLPAALEQLGRYYSDGTLVQQDRELAIRYLREASFLGNLNAQIRMAELFIKGFGSPYDYEDAYHFLYNAVTADKNKHSQISYCLTELEKLMHPKVVRAAKRPLNS
jgi:TPR repeat protein